VLEITERVCDVSPFASTYEPMTNVPIVKAALGYHHPVNGELFILVLNQALFFGDAIENMLLCPMQIRQHGVTVDDCPVQFGGKSHSISFPDEDVSLPLELNGCISYLPVFCPSDDDLELGTYLELTSPT
jgi:hypothetical protein